MEATNGFYVNNNEFSETWIILNLWIALTEVDFFEMNIFFNTKE